MHIEWLQASTNEPEIVPADSSDFYDEFGHRLAPGKLGLYVGDGEGCAVLEGTQAEIADWLTRALTLVGHPMTETQMTEAMVRFDIGHPDHLPWEQIVADVRRDVDALVTPPPTPDN